MSDPAQTTPLHRGCTTGDASEALARLISHANTAAQTIAPAQDATVSLGTSIATAARRTAAPTLGRDQELEVVLFDREGRSVGRAG